MAREARQRSVRTALPIPSVSLRTSGPCGGDNKPNTIFQSSNLSIFQSSNLPIFQSSNLPIFQSPNLPIFQSFNLSIPQSSNPPIFQSYNLPIFNEHNKHPIPRCITLKHPDTQYVQIQLYLQRGMIKDALRIQKRTLQRGPQAL
jgi:hypothetical protein